MSSYQIRKTPGDTEWFRHDRFGMFIHFGLYSMPARHEWIKSRECIEEEKYDKYFKYFNPDMFNPRELARKAKAAGMKYVVFTTKHHEGFCLWDTKYTDFNIMNTPYGKDLLREFVDAFRAEGIRIGFYYSLIDWHHPDFTIDVYHPRRKDADAVQKNRGRDMKKYAEYMRNQVTELLTGYGKIDILWFDFSYAGQSVPENPSLVGKHKEDWEADKLIATARSINPDIIINNRTELEQDLWTPEQIAVDDWVKDKDGNLVPWEVCHTFSGSWGYHRDEVSWKSPNQLIDLLVRTVSYGGNLIMNVGPTSRGYLDSRAEDALGVYENWMKYNSRSIYGCTMAEPEILEQCPKGCMFTQSEDGKRLYIHLQCYPHEWIKLQNMGSRVDYAQFLDDGSEVPFTTQSEKNKDLDYCFVDTDTDAVALFQKRNRSDYQVIEVFLK